MSIHPYITLNPLSKDPTIINYLHYKFILFLVYVKSYTHISCMTLDINRWLDSDQIAGDIIDPTNNKSH